MVGVVRGWRFQWPFRWPIVRVSSDASKPPLPPLDTLESQTYCNKSGSTGCGQYQWKYKGQKMGYCYRHLQDYDWVPRPQSVIAAPDEHDSLDYQVGQWKKVQ